MGKDKIGALKLCGLIIGPILGSGIIIIPPLSLAAMGSWAFTGWVVTVLISFMFAVIFGKLSILFPGDAGVSNAIESAFGNGYKLLASYFLTGAGLFGPVAVIVTAASYLNINGSLNECLIGIAVLLLVYAVLLTHISNIGTVTFVMSSLAAVTLFTGSLLSLMDNSLGVVPTVSFDGYRFGYGLLLLFWTIVGWEILGNFSNDIRDPRRTLPKAVTLSALVIATISLMVVAALQSFGGEEGVSVATVLTPLFGRFAGAVTAFLVFSLCGVTYIAFTGAVSRLLSALSAEGRLPAWLKKRNKSCSPMNGVSFMVFVHFVLLMGVYADVMSVEKLVSIANSFFLANALCGVVTGIRLFPAVRYKLLSGVLALMLTGILLFSELYMLCIIAAMAVFVPRLKKRRKTLS